MSEKFYTYILRLALAAAVLVALELTGLGLCLLLRPALVLMAARYAGAAVLLGLGLLSLGTAGIRALCR